MQRHVPESMPVYHSRIFHRKLTVSRRATHCNRVRPLEARVPDRRWRKQLWGFRHRKVHFGRPLYREVAVHMRDTRSALKDTRSLGKLIVWTWFSSPVTLLTLKCYESNVSINPHSCRIKDVNKYYYMHSAFREFLRDSHFLSLETVFDRVLSPFGSIHS